MDIILAASTLPHILHLRPNLYAEKNTHNANGAGSCGFGMGPYGRDGLPTNGGRRCQLPAMASKQQTALRFLEGSGDLH